MTFADAQRNMRFGYFSGAPGIAASALAWLVAGVVASWVSASAAVIALFVGGMLIHPVGVVLAKALGRPGKHAAGNPLGALAMESTVLLILCLPITYAVSRFHVQWFFPAMLLVIGGRYLTFCTLYGMRIYWAFGAALALAAYLLMTARAEPSTGAWVGGAIEAAFAAIIFFSARREEATLGAQAPGRAS